MNRPVIRATLRILAALSVPAAGQAAAGGYVSQNHEWTAACNADGFVLTSAHPVARYFEGGAASRVVTGTETLFLGRSCDAYHALFGAGTWCWANGGFAAEFAETRFGFPRQELTCPENPALGAGCRC